MATTIRPATSADIPAIMALARESPTAAHWSTQQYEKLFSATRPERLVLVADEAGAVKAFVVALAAGPEWEVENIVVATTARRRRLATRLITELIEQARDRGAAQLWLEVRESNLPARGLYQSLGFVECGRRTRYYSNPVEDAVAYRIDFT